MLNNPRVIKLNKKLLKAIVRHRPRKELKIKRKILKVLAQSHLGE